jgi:PDZ domain-containing protein
VKHVTPGRLFAAGLVLLAAVLAAFILPSSQYIFLPDKAHPVQPLVVVPGGHDPATGGIYFVDVVVRKASLLERLFGGLHKGADLYPASAVNPPGVNDAQRRQIDLQDMQQSQQIAAAVALKAAGYKVAMTPIGAQVEEVGPGEPAVGHLEPDDIITAVDGKPVRSPVDVFEVMQPHHPGDVVRFTFTRDGKTHLASIKTINAPGPSNRAIVGVILTPALDIHLPKKVSIDAGGVGGPSAGLAFALEVYQQLGHNITHGHKVAVTGEIDADGSVQPIGGVKQKTYGAREAGVDAFLVPVGDNARDARKYAGHLKIIPVKSFQQALHALATAFPSS